MIKHTPGPWQFNEQKQHVVDKDNNHTIAVPFAVLRSEFLPTDQQISESLDELWMNAQLISAAPELLMCCEASLSYLLLEDHFDKNQLIRELKRVIKKARYE